MTNVLSPIVTSRLEKAAIDNGFDKELPREGDWLEYATTKCPLRAWLNGQYLNWDIAKDRKIVRELA